MKKNSRFFLVYTIILFSVAFILILFSSFKGVRYKDAQYEKSKLFQGAQESVVKLTEKNESLEKENAEKTKQIETLTEEKAKTEEQLKIVNEQKETVVKNMDMLTQVQNLYRNKNYSRAREILEEIDPTALSENARILYNSLKSRL